MSRAASFIACLFLIAALAKGDDVASNDTETTQESQVTTATPRFVYTRENLGLEVGQECYDFVKAYDPNGNILEQLCMCFLAWCGRPLTPEELILRREYSKKVDGRVLKVRLRTYMPVIVTNSIIGFAGLFGNLIIIIVIAAFMPRKSVVNVMLVSMTTADFLVCGICIPLIKRSDVASRKSSLLQKVPQLGPQGPDHTYSLAYNSWYGGEMLCKFIWYLFFLAFSCSCISMTLISVERYIVICHPMKAPSINTLSRARKMAVGTWVFAALIAIPMLFITEYDEARSACEKTMIGMKKPIYYFMTLIICVYFIPSCVMTFSYVSVGIELMKSIKITTQMQHQGDEKAAKDSDDIKGRISLMKTLVAVMIAFIVLWGPILIWYLLSGFLGFTVTNDAEAFAMWEYCLTTISLAQSAINPFIYIATSAQFRLGFRKLIGMAPPPKKGSTVSGSTAISQISKTTEPNSNKV
ncbi:hypothetical protein CAPTEDRAFT_224577 [Capitella teleta]|uniref:G-protein coupled receptors family 1 profile domain-containing protein n=1 Tax=Capitella teleta TaxID=283909 RepID=R7VA02_CAPTE|nr:hypothetical protein CAPTEDRAFT_224577 [Capitella teleta]|eukprot:ELU15434.1 hypothetical protein CAPTEDRAFT_224577 [Capitella teleta]